MDNIDLSDFFTTKAESIDFSTRLAALSAEVYQNDFDLDKAFAKHFGIQKKDKLMTLLRDNHINTTATGEIKKFLDNLQAKITSLPVVELTIAFEPTTETIKKLSEWFVVNNKLQVLFKFTVDPKIVGGAEINFKGKHLDFTVKEKFEKILQASIAEPDKPPVPLHEREPIIKQSIEHVTIGR